MFTAVVTVLVTKLVARYALKDGVEPHDPLDVTTIHGIGGSVGFLMTGITSYVFINPAGANGLTYGAVGLVHLQVAALVTLWACVVPAVFVLLYLCDLVVPISASTDTQRVFKPVVTCALPKEVSTEPTTRAQRRRQLQQQQQRSNAAVTEEEDWELEREKSLYRKLSRYFSSKRADSMAK
jgi:hypothetical protein